MVPILMNGDAVVGFLSETMACLVTEERNGIFELSMKYPVAGSLFVELAVDRFIKVKPNDTSDLQMFRIYEITKPINGVVTVKAEHLSYALSHYPVNNISVTGNAALVIDTILTNANANLETAHNFSVATTDISASKQFEYAVGSVRSALGGSDGSVLDVFGGEYEFDNYVIRLHQHRGADTGVIVAYGKNLTGLEVTTSSDSSYTHLFPYCKDDEENIVTITNKRIAVTNNSGIAQRVLIKDFSSFFADGEEKNAANLLSHANAWLADNDINAPSIHVKVSFVHLWQSPEYSSIAALEKVSLCDYVTVWHKALDVNIKAQVVKTVYNALSERYESLEIGSAKASFANTVRQATDKVRLETASAYTAAIDAATKAITGYSGGYVVLHPSLNPQELLVMNTDDKNTATKLWRLNVGGFGYSKNGYNGPFDTAITMEGAINASFITTGTLTANIIRAGILSSALGDSYFNLESGLIHTDSAEIVGGTVSIGGTDYRTLIREGSIKQYLSAGTTEIGGLIPSGSGSNYYQTLYVSKLSNAKGVLISQQASDGSMTSIAEFLKTEVKIQKTAKFASGLYTNQSSADSFSSVTHYRTAAFGGSGTNEYTATCIFGCGIAHNKPSAVMQIQNYGDSTIQARLDVYASEGEAMICMRGNYNNTVSNELELGKNIWFAGEINAKKFNVSSTEEIKENVVQCGSALDVLRQATIYQYNLIPDLPETVEAETVDDLRSEDETLQFISREVPVLQSTPDGQDDQSVSEEAEPKDSLGFIINEDTPEILLSEDKHHIDLYTVIALNWKATQEILSRLEALEGSES